MIDRGKRSVLGVLVDVVDYDASVARILEAARSASPYAVSALAVHGVMTGVQDRRHRFRLNNLDLVTPDGQPVRWALNRLHHARLEDRVYGPNLMLHLCNAAVREGLPIYLYGSTPEVLDSLGARLRDRFPGLAIAGTEPSKFGRTTPAERDEIVERIKSSGARLVFVGLGCPRQEIFAYEYRDLLQMPLVAVGAAFDYHSGRLKEPPRVVQRWGFQWLYRLLQDPRRLWKRYLVLNTRYVGLLALEVLRIRRRDPNDVSPPEAEVLVG